MRKLRSTAILLAFLLVVQPAYADTLSVQGLEQKTSLRLVQPIDSVLSPWLYVFNHRYPNVTVRITPEALDVSQALTKKLSADVLVLQGAKDWSSVWESGQFANLAGQSFAAALIERMYPSIVAAVVQDNGIYGVPIEILPNSCLLWQERGWNAAGLTASDIPTSFSGLLDFLDSWAAQPVNHQVSVLNGLDSRSFSNDVYIRWLSEMLIRHYAIQCASQGRSVDYTDDTFVSLLERARKTGQALYQHDNHQRDEGLFAVVTDNSQVIPHIICLRLTDADPTFYPMTMKVLTINSGTREMELALALLESYFVCVMNRPGNNYTNNTFSQFEHDADVSWAQLFPEADQPVLGEYPFTVPSVQEMLNTLSQVTVSGDDAILIEERIQSLQTILPYLETMHWYYNEDELSTYQEMAAYFSFDSMPDITGKEITTAINRFISGTDSALALGQALNKMLNH